MKHCWLFSISSACAGPQALINTEELAKVKELFAAKSQGGDVSAEMALFQVHTLAAYSVVICVVVCHITGGNVYLKKRNALLRLGSWGHVSYYLHGEGSCENGLMNITYVSIEVDDCRNSPCISLLGQLQTVQGRNPHIVLLFRKVLCVVSDEQNTNVVRGQEQI